MRCHSTSGASSRTSTPFISTEPSVASTRRAARFSRVVLPEPVLPMMAVVWPAVQRRLTPDSTACSAPG
jgi:hypothetical protein